MHTPTTEDGQPCRTLFEEDYLDYLGPKKNYLRLFGPQNGLFGFFRTENQIFIICAVRCCSCTRRLRSLPVRGHYSTQRTTCERAQPVCPRAGRYTYEETRSARTKGGPQKVSASSFSSMPTASVVASDRAKSGLRCCTSVDKNIAIVARRCEGLRCPSLEVVQRSETRTASCYNNDICASNNDTCASATPATAANSTSLHSQKHTQRRQAVNSACLPAFL